MTPRLISDVKGTNLIHFYIDVTFFSIAFVHFPFFLLSFIDFSSFSLPSPILTKLLYEEWLIPSEF